MNKISKTEIFRYFKAIKLYKKIRVNSKIETLKNDIQKYYQLKEPMPDSFYNLFQNAITNNPPKKIIQILQTKDIYQLINYLKSTNINSNLVRRIVEAHQFYSISTRQIEIIIKNLKNQIQSNKPSKLNEFLQDKQKWQLSPPPTYSESELIELAYKMLTSIGLDNSLDLINGKYGEINYEHIKYMFQKLNVKNNSKRKSEVITNFLFSNKKDPTNPIRQMLTGNFLELFLNFSYFYNNLDIFIDKLGTKMSHVKLKALLSERYLPKDIENPEITGDIIEDMIASYYCKSHFLDTSESEIYEKNRELYNSYLKRKNTSSIPRIELQASTPYICEMLKLNDPRNLVLGYRSANCFRPNGEAAILFDNFLKSDNMRLLSISTLEYKDFAMVLLMRNGNVLIAQGIETSNYSPKEIKGEKLYETVKSLMNQLMIYMNGQNDEIVATIIGSTNENVSNYNHNRLPFIIPPILTTSGNFYNGIYNYQCLLDLANNKTLSNIRLYQPQAKYYDSSSKVLERNKDSESEDYTSVEIEKRLISLRYLRSQVTGNTAFYQTMINKDEQATICSEDWYITTYTDGTIDSFIDSTTSEETKQEYTKLLSKIYKSKKP